MNPALMLNTLNLNDRLVGRCVQHPVVAAGTCVIKIYPSPERFGPEACGQVNIGRSAIDQYCA